MVRSEDVISWFVRKVFFRGSLGRRYFVVPALGPNYLPGESGIASLPYNILILKKEKPLKSHIRNLLEGEQGQDLIEYTLLLAFVVLTSAALFIGVGSSIRGIWTQSSRILSQACIAGS